MVSSFDMAKLCSLLQDFHMLTQIRITVFNDRLEELTAWPQHVPPFCRLIRSDPDGLAQCRKCDREACATALQKRGTHIYRCHAGLTEAVSPVFLGNIIIGYLLFGHIFAWPDAEEGRRRIAGACAGYRIDPQRLADCCRRLPVRSETYIRSASNLLHAVASYLCMERMIFLRQNDLPLQLDSYIRDHLSEPLSAQRLCTHLQIGRTTLYELSRQSYGRGIAQQIRFLRIEKAKTLLLEQPALSIAEVAQACGFPEYNYFITIFRKQTGTTPARFRTGQAGRSFLL